MWPLARLRYDAALGPGNVRDRQPLSSTEAARPYGVNVYDISVALGPCKRRERGATGRPKPPPCARARRAGPPQRGHHGVACTREVSSNGLLDARALSSTEPTRRMICGPTIRTRPLARANDAYKYGPAPGYFILSAEARTQGVGLGEAAAPEARLIETKPPRAMPAQGRRRRRATRLAAGAELKPIRQWKIESGAPAGEYHNSPSPCAASVQQRCAAVQTVPPAAVS